MSFSISISGHSDKPHNAQVKAAVAAAEAELRKIEGLTGSISGYSNDAGSQETFGVDLSSPAAETEA